MQVKLTNNLGMLLLAIWLISMGVLHFVTVASNLVGLILAVLAIVAGVLILLGR